MYITKVVYPAYFVLISYVLQNMQLETFFDSTRLSFTHPEVRAWAEELWAQRDRRLRGEAGVADL